MAGSHSDTVPAGGRFDGIAGVLAALEAAQALKDAGHRLRHPLEIVDFLAEEPSEYGMSCVGSRLMAGRLGRDDLALTRADGETLAIGIRRMGGDPDRLAEAVRAPGSLAGYVELHIEQGPVLEARGLGIGVVTAIVGITRYAVTVEGRADHAGATPMHLRRDALTTASRLVVKAEELARALNRDGVYFVATVGRMTVTPNAANVVPGKVRSHRRVPQRFGRRARRLHRRPAAFRRGGGRRQRHRDRLRTLERRAAGDLRRSGAQRHPRGLRGRRHRLHGHGQRRWARCHACGRRWPYRHDLHSVPGGRSHCPEEWVEPRDLKAGAAVLLETLIRLDTRLD